jgi:hypothetical protein
MLYLLKRLWCKLFHKATTPIHGYYTCGKCQLRWRVDYE